jgi:DNA-binding NtrC family response regulator
MTARVTILVIDDEPGIREMLTFALSADDLDIETADSGYAAVEAVRRRKFDVAITDLKMPGMDGAATVEALRRIDPEIGIIVATAFASLETTSSCMQCGAYDYIQKPFDLTELRLMIDRAVQKRRPRLGA